MLALDTNKSYHFLLVHCNSYKDGVSVILSLQCIEALKKQYPNAKVSFLLHSSMQDFFHNNPYIESIFCIDSDTIVRELKNAHITIALSLVSDKKSTMAIFRAGIKARIGVFSHLYSLFFNYKMKQKRASGKKHEAVYNFDIVRFVQCKEFCYPKLYLKIHAIQKAQADIIARFGEEILNKGFIAICPSAGLQGLGWRAKNFFIIANAIAPLHAVLILAPHNETQSYKAMLPQFPNLSSKNLFVSKDDKKEDNMQDLLALIHASRLFIANNNTLLHAASALDSSTFSIFPYTKAIHPNRYAPISPHKKHVVCTPFGIFKAQDSMDHLDDENMQGLHIESITPDIVLAILQAKFFPTEKLFIEPIFIPEVPKKEAQEKAEQDIPIAKSEKKEEETKKLDIQDSAFLQEGKKSIIDERG